MLRSVRALRCRRQAAAALALALGASGCGVAMDPTENVTTGEAILGLSDAVAGLREDDAMLQAQLDSLRGVVARQDSIIARLAAATGVPLPSR
ncbi:MAG TPA: hypothetical protein VFZ11_15150 [Gemmatimonadaceae bacterium]